MITPWERWIQLEGFSPRDGYRSILFFTIRVLLKKMASLKFWIVEGVMNSLRPLILITSCIIPRLLWTCLSISYPWSYHAIILKWKINFILARLLEKIAHPWSITLAWTNMSPRQLKPFIAHRIAEIQGSSTSNKWHHVRSAENPADILSRGTTSEIQGYYKCL
jgi:hypothetical protein